QVISVETTGPISALTRSFSLIQGLWWGTVVFFSLFVPEAMTLALGTPVILQGFAGIGAAYAVWHLDFRARHEALTTEQLAWPVRLRHRGNA
ncbi:MAG TPA: hypothetical protein VF148_01440, partial [Acidimicrobiia bacterium]